MSSVEIEKKFLVKNLDFISLSKSSKKIKQGYLSSQKERTVRIRITNDIGYITIKGKSENAGLSRFEWEKEIPVVEAEELFMLCEPGAIEKTRYLVDYEGYVFEVDVFDGENKGLVLAEVELNSINDKPKLPNWIGEEVTGDNRYYNSQLTKKPYNTWK